MARLADAGKLVVNIDSEFSLDQVADAHKRSESSRSQGKIIINVAC
jgi:NADPH:quinone reductase-like Zn-dependent oxidoreductase